MGLKLPIPGLYHLDELEYLEGLNKKLGGKLNKGRIWRIEGTKNGIPYVIQQPTYPGTNILYDRGILVSVPLKTKRQFNIFGNIGISDILKHKIGNKGLVKEIGIAGKDTEEGKRFLERNRKEITKLAEIANPIGILEVKNGEMLVLIGYGDLFDLAYSPLKSRRYNEVPTALDLLIAIAKREN